MATKIRMCVVCKNRFSQDTLHRFKCTGSEIVKHDNIGRSFYVCSVCLSEKENQLTKKLSKICKKKFTNTPKEMFF